MEVESNSSNGGIPGQSTQGSDEGGTMDGGSNNSGESDGFRRLSAKLDLLQDDYQELRQAIVSSRQAAQPAHQEEDDFDGVDDDSPLTAAQARRLLQKQSQRTANQVQQQQLLEERREWDSKARDAFPLIDPEFQKEFKQQWREAVASGLDPNHAKAIYQVAKTTALVVGAKGLNTNRQTRNTDGDSEFSGEAPTTNPGASARGSRANLSEKAQKQLDFYNLTGSKTKAQVDAFRQKLLESESKNKRRQA